MSNLSTKKKEKSEQPYNHQTRFLGFNFALEAITSSGVSGTTKLIWSSFTLVGVKGFNSDGESHIHSTIIGVGSFSTEGEVGGDSWYKDMASSLRDLWYASSSFFDYFKISFK